MKGFMDETFLLNSPVAVELYERFAKDMPIFDYHCHLDPKEIWEDKKYRNMTELWLAGDHYKWRAMRSNGITEDCITGDAPDYEKFMAWAKTMPHTVGNPLFHWSHLELKRYFNIDEVLNEDTAEQIWQRCNAMLQEDAFSTRSLIQRSNVKYIGTTDDPTDSLEYHQKIREEGSLGAKVCPTFRPDKGLEIKDQAFLTWLDKLSAVTGRKIQSYREFLAAMEERVHYFHNHGCLLSDTGISEMTYEEATIEEVEQIFNRVLQGEAISLQEVKKYKTYTLVFLGELYASLGWTMQLHMGALRNNNTRKFLALGRDAGFDSIGDKELAVPLSRFLDQLEKNDSLPKTILYTVNPKDNYILGSMLGNFQTGGVPGKIQFGSAWWFNDHKDGMYRQMVDLANLGLLSRFVGMLTDSRSFLSYTRHEYFRRILCNLLGEWVVNGEMPNDMKWLGQMVENICYHNAKQYFGVPLD
ncbi:glucuronate isomerase [Ammoniphilus sp. YIM 78166]|uniref:glucuronate isomerase n=1 Tax=Ammoniphilus sp. YIM 78166 TaxID=1644106 RepID=UPI00106FC74F|nr:glucuronate isomerase [Ammoniphilus sp. YIM 78166]